MPLSSAPNSCAVISRCRSRMPSANGTAYVPSSSRLLQTARPSRSQYRIFTRFLRRLVNTNRCPARTSNSRWSRTSACRLSKLLRMSHGVRHKYTRSLAGGSSPQHVQHGPQGRGVHARADAQPLAGRQHKFQRRLRRVLRPPRAPVHQSEPNRPCLLEPFPPGVERVLRQSLFPTELLHGNSAALLRCDSFGPLVCLWVGGSLLDGGLAHDTTLQRPLTDQEERFTRRLPK